MKRFKRLGSIIRLLPALTARRAACALCILILVPAAVAAGRPTVCPAAAAPAGTPAPVAPASASPKAPKGSPPPSAAGLSAASASAAAAVTASAPAPSPGPTAAPVPAATEAKGADLRAVQAETAAPPAPKPAAGSSALFLRVYKGSQCVVALRMADGREIAVRVMICSTGRSPGMTPNGTFRISSKYLYRQLEGAMGQYCSRFNGSILFHSVPIANTAKTQASGRSRMLVDCYNQLGRMASHGCVRLLVRDAKWIYGNCPAGTRVEVVSGESPYGGGRKPKLASGSPYMSADGKYGWDPTDPDAKNPYRNPPASATPAAPTQAPSEPPAPTAEPTAEPEAASASPPPPTETPAPA